MSHIPDSAKRRIVSGFVHFGSELQACSIWCQHCQSLAPNVCVHASLTVHEEQEADLTVYLDCAMGFGVTSIAEAVVGSISFIDLSAHLC